MNVLRSVLNTNSITAFIPFFGEVLLDFQLEQKPLYYVDICISPVLFNILLKYCVHRNLFFGKSNVTCF